MFTIKNLDCDAVFRKHQSRTTTMQKGKFVGDCDKLVTWHKPKSCPKGLNKDEFLALPSSITVREIYYYIVIPGFRFFDKGDDILSRCLLLLQCPNHWNSARGN